MPMLLRIPVPMNTPMILPLVLIPEGGMAEEAAHIETTPPQTLHYTLANQQVQFHRIGEDGQVQVVSVLTATEPKHLV